MFTINCDCYDLTFSDEEELKSILPKETLEIWENEGVYWLFELKLTEQEYKLGRNLYFEELLDLIEQ